MISKRSDQMDWYDVGNVFDVELPRGSFHAQLAEASGRLLKDDDFAAFYSEKHERPSVSPSLLAQTYQLRPRLRYIQARSRRC